MHSIFYRLLDLRSYSALRLNQPQVVFVKASLCVAFTKTTWFEALEKRCKL